MGKSWDSYADEWDNNEDAILFSEKTYSSPCEVINPEGLHILDFGCGTGLLTERLIKSAKKIVAIDSSDKMISVLNSKRISKVDTLNITLSEESQNLHEIFNERFDLIVASSVCAFLPNYVENLLLLRQMLKPNGIFVQWDWLKNDIEEKFGFTSDNIKSAFQKSGLEMVSVKEAFSLGSIKDKKKVVIGIAKNIV